MRIPYNLTNDCVVEGEMKFIDKGKEERHFPVAALFGTRRRPSPQDKILAVDGTPVKASHELLAQVQKRTVNIIVARDSRENGRVSSADADTLMDTQVHWVDLQRIADSIGTANPVKSAGEYVLLNPVTPVTRADLVLTRRNGGICCRARRAAEIH